MKKLSLFIAILFAIALGTVAGLRATAAPNDSAQIAVLYQRFTTAFRHKDLAGVMSVYVPNQSLFVFDVDTPRQHVGWADYRADWKGLFASIKGLPSFSISDLAVTVSGDVAYSHSIQTMLARQTTGGTTKLVARVTDVMQKINGTWLIVQEHVSVPVNFTTMKPDLLSKP